MIIRKGEGAVENMDRLIGKLSIKGNIVLKTGLHIGGSEAEMQIGGVDNPIIKTIDGKPYIPGSSLKGKLRSLLECATGNVKIIKKEYHPCSCGKCYICKLFGSTNEKSKRTRLIFRDCHLSQEDETKDKIINVKAENVIDRLTSKANHPRHIERVGRNIKFDYEIIMNLFESDLNKSGDHSEHQDIKEIKGDNEAKYINDYIKVLLTSFKLLENDYLGGNGSRGYGQVEITSLNGDEENTNGLENMMSISSVYLDEDYFHKECIGEEGINTNQITLDSSEISQLLKKIREQNPSSKKKQGEKNDKNS